MEAAARAGRLEWVQFPRASVTLHAPLDDPEKFLCIGLNYIDHAEETKSPIPKEPPLFAKFANAIVDWTAPIVRPRGCQQLDYEVELAFVVGRTAKDVPQDNALDYIFGYTIVHDVSARDFQLVTTQWMAGKICDTFAPMGHWIADRSEDPDPHVLDLSTWVNGTRLQHGNTKNLIYNINVLVAYLSAHLTLMPGDIVATGTPAGVGFTRKPPVLLKGGDVVRMEITGLGHIENPVVEAGRPRTLPARGERRTALLSGLRGSQATVRGRGPAAPRPKTVRRTRESPPRRTPLRRGGVDPRGRRPPEGRACDAHRRARSRRGSGPLPLASPRSSRSACSRLRRVLACCGSSSSTRRHSAMASSMRSSR